jgi:hypothetical protein
MKCPSSLPSCWLPCRVPKMSWRNCQRQWVDNSNQQVTTARKRNLKPLSSACPAKCLNALRLYLLERNIKGAFAFLVEKGTDSAIFQFIWVIKLPARYLRQVRVELTRVGYTVKVESLAGVWKTFPSHAAPWCIKQSVIWIWKKLLDQFSGMKPL